MQGKGFKAWSTKLYIQVSQISKATWVTVTLTTIGKLIMYYTNYHHTNHNMEMCQSKKKEKPIVVTMEINAQPIKQLKPLTYPYHICGLNRHKLTTCLKFNEMKTMFKDKRQSKCWKETCGWCKSHHYIYEYGGCACNNY